jgi:predicted polyphosphate/ATP-dependent NAD kinase
MNCYEAAFEEVLSMFAKTVIIKHQKPLLDEQKQEVIDKNENVIYVSGEKETICTINEKQDYEKTDLGYTKAKTKSVIGKFRKKDAEFLNKKNTIIYTSPDTGITSEYTIADVIEEAGHMKVLLT